MKGSSNPLGNIPYAEIVPANPSQHFAARVQTISRHAMLRKLCESISFRAFGTFRHLFSDWRQFQKTLVAAVQGKFLRKVEVIGEKNAEIRTSFTLEIDWERSEILSRDWRGNTFVVKRDRPIDEQVDKGIIALIRFLRKRIEKGEVEALTAFYTWVPGTESQVQEWRKVAGTVPLSSAQTTALQTFYSKAHGISINPNQFKELTVSVRSG